VIENGWLRLEVIDHTTDRESSTTPDLACAAPHLGQGDRPWTTLVEASAWSGRLRWLRGGEDLVKRTVTTEKYYTAPSLAERCLDLLQRHVDLAAYDAVVEPSAGDGSFLRLLPVQTRIGVDIDPSHPSVVEADFLRWAPPRSCRRVLAVGNPPFGQRGALAVAFLAHACSFSDTVAFILPRSFKKYTFQNRVHPFFHLVDSFDCTEFVDPAGRPVVVSTVFQIWSRRDHERPLVALPAVHDHFDMRHAHLSRVTADELARLRASYEFTVPQVGANFAPRDVTGVVRGSHWFIRPRVAGVRERFEQLDFAFLDGMNTAHKSLSKKDIVAAYQAVCDVAEDVIEVRAPGVNT
jgi:hypothetical protein